MKSSSIIFLVLAVVLISFSSCEKDDCPAIPQQINFTGTSTWVADIDPGTTEVLAESGKVLIIGQISEWYEETNITQNTGQSFWTVNWLMEADFSGATLWGTAVINVGVKNQGDAVLGKWELTWEGTLTNAVFDPVSGFFSDGDILVDAVGVGVSGNTVGMAGQWTYTMDIAEGFVYKSEGHIK